MDSLSDSSGSVQNIRSIPLITAKSTSKTTQTDEVNCGYCYESDSGCRKIDHGDVYDAWKSHNAPVCPMYNNSLISPMSLCHLQTCNMRSLYNFALSWYPFHSLGTCMPFNMLPPVMPMTMVMSSPPTPTCSAMLANPSYHCINRTANYCESNGSIVSSISGKKVRETCKTQGENKKPLKYYKFITDDNCKSDLKNRFLLSKLESKYLNHNRNCESLHGSGTSVNLDSFVKKSNESRSSSEMNRESRSFTRSSLNYNGLQNSSNCEKDKKKRRRSYFLTTSDSSNQRPSKSELPSQSSLSKFNTDSDISKEGAGKNKSIIKRYICKGLSNPVNSSINNDKNEPELKRSIKEVSSGVKKLANMLCDFDCNHDLSYNNSDIYNNVIRKTIDNALNDNKSIQHRRNHDEVQKLKNIKLSSDNERISRDLDNDNKIFTTNSAAVCDNHCFNAKCSTSDTLSKYKSPNSTKISASKIENLTDNSRNLSSNSSGSKDSIFRKSGETVECYRSDYKTSTTEKPSSKTDGPTECNFENRSKYRLLNIIEKPLLRTDKPTECDCNLVSRDKSNNITEDLTVKTENAEESENNYLTKSVVNENISRKVVTSNNTIKDTVNDQEQLSNEIKLSNKYDPQQFVNQYDNLSRYGNAIRNLSFIESNKKDHLLKNIYKNIPSKFPEKPEEINQKVTSRNSDEVDTNVTNAFKENFNNCIITDSYLNNYEVSNKNFKTKIYKNVFSNKNELAENSNSNDVSSNKGTASKQNEIREELLQIHESFIKDVEKNNDEVKAKKKKFENITAHFILPSMGKIDNKNDSTIDSSANNEQDNKNFTKISFSVNYDPDNPERIVVGCEQDGKNMHGSTMNNDEDEDDLFSVGYKTTCGSSVTNNDSNDKNNDFYNNNNDGFCNNSINYTSGGDDVNNDYKNYWQTDVPSSVSEASGSEASEAAAKKRSRFSQYSIFNNVETLSIISEEDEESCVTNHSTTTNTSNGGSIDTYIVNPHCSGDIKRLNQLKKFDKDCFF